MPASNMGVYFSSNDAVLDWAIPFLKSLRAHNPHIPVSLIPFDENCEKTIELANEFDFSVFNHKSFAALEEIGAKLELGHSPYGPNWFRRYASFWGEFEHFLYLDARQVILSDLTRFVMATQRFELDLVYYDTALNQVYNPGEIRTKFIQTGRARGFNSGRWASRRNLFSLREFNEAADMIKNERVQFNARNTDQAFINFCCDNKGIRSASISDILGDLVSTGWARQVGRPYQDEEGVWRLWDHGGLEHKKKLLLMHWAGIGFQDGLPNSELLKKFGKIPRQRNISKIDRALRRSFSFRKLINKL